MVDSKWYEKSHSCEDFKEYVQGKTNEARLTEALEVKRRKDATAAEQREREFAEKMAQKNRERAGLDQKSGVISYFPIKSVSCLILSLLMNSIYLLITTLKRMKRVEAKFIF